MSTDDQPLLDRSTIEAVFRSLGERLARRGVIGDAGELLHRLDEAGFAFDLAGHL